MRRHFAAVPLAVLLAATSIAQSRAFVVGVLRADGIVIPFAAHDGKGWRPVWIEPQPDVDVPINIASVPKGWWGPIAPADTWQAWLVGGGAPRSLHVRQPDLVMAGCQRQIGLRTDYRSADALAPITEHPYPKDGLAVSPPRPVEPIETVPKTAPEWKDFAGIVTEAINKQERVLANDRDFDHPVSEKKREAITPAIEAIYAYGTEPRVYAVEAAREYWTGPGPQATCKALAFGRVWLWRDRSGLKPITTQVDIERCDREDTSFMLPLGVLHVGGVMVWAVQFAGWDEERYDIITVTKNGALVKTGRFGGYC